MKSLFVFALSMTLGLIAAAQPNASKPSLTQTQEIHHSFLKAILAKQGSHGMAKGIATSKRVTGESGYIVTSTDSSISDSARYVYSGTRGSSFDFDFMQFERLLPVTSLYGDAHSLSEVDILADSMIFWGTNNDYGTLQVERINTTSYGAGNQINDAKSFYNNFSQLDGGSRIVPAFDASGRLSVATEYNWNGLSWDTVQEKILTYDAANQIIADTMKIYSGGIFYLEQINTYQYDGSGNLTLGTTSGWYDGGWELLWSFTQTYYPNNKLKTTVLAYSDHITGLVPFSKDSVAYDPGQAFYTCDEASIWDDNIGNWVKSSMTIKTLNAQGLPDTVKYSYWDAGSAAYILAQATAYSYDADGDPVLGRQYYYPATGVPEYSVAYHYYYNVPNTAPTAVLSGYNCDGAPISVATSFNPAALQWSLNGNIVSETCAEWSNGITVAGGGAKGSTPSKMNYASGVFVTGNGDVYVADELNNRIQKWVPGAAAAVTVAGGNGAGAALNQLNAPAAVVVFNGDVYVADKGNNRVVKWSAGQSSGMVVAGGNGAGNAANQLNGPSGLFIQSNGDIYVADELNNRIEKWAPGATVGIKVAGKPNGSGAGSALNALNHPSGVFVTAANDIYIADKNNHRIVKWTAGAATGTLVAGGNGSGAALNQLSNPSGVSVDGSGNVYISDMLNYRIVRWTPGAAEGAVIAAGNGAGTGPAHLRRPTGLFITGAGTMYVADQTNHRIQMYNTSINNAIKAYAAGTYEVSAISFNGTIVNSNATTVTGSDYAAVGTAEGALADGQQLDYLSVNCRKMLTLKDAAGGNIPGNIKASLNKDASVQTFNGRPYLQRHYDIQPASNGAALVTLYVHPSEFKAYNTYVTANNLSYPLLPSSASNTAALANIYITQFTGAAGAGTTGPGNQYDALQKVLIPNSSITASWNGSYWVLSFPVTSLSGGFFIHSGSVALKEQQTAAITSVAGDLKMDVYPNPARSELNVTIPASGNGASIQLLDMSGRIMMQQAISSERTKLDLGMLTPGTYIVRYTDDKQSSVVKIVKE